MPEYSPNSKESILDTPKKLQNEVDALIVKVPHFQQAYKKTGLPSLRLRDAGFRSLCQTIVSQQLSVAAAASIWQRLDDQGLIHEKRLLTSDETTLRNQGLSRQKIRYLKSLATHAIDYDGLMIQDDETVIKTLTAVTGIGRWTAEIYCLFSLNRPDIIAANDLALQVSAMALFDLPQHPNERQLRELATDWSPHRSAAAYLLWAYYAVIKQRQGIN